MARNSLRLANKLSLTHSSSSFAKLLDAGTKSKSSSHVRATHACILKTHFIHEVFINNRLIDVYGKCGRLNYARTVFDKMPTKNAFSYNSIIGALTVSGSIDEAERVFISMPEPDQCSWNLMISGFAQLEVFDRSLEHFWKMHCENFVLNEYSYGSALSACAGLRDAVIGMQIHASLAKSRFMSDVYMGSALIDMYAKCGDVDCAQQAFDGMTERNTVTWNSLITCYEQNGPASEALNVFLKMMACGVQPDEMTLASVVSACASLCAGKEGRAIHARVVKSDKLCNDLVISNALVDMYAKCRMIKEARWIFDRMPLRNVVSETSMVSGYAKAASVETARSMFCKMMDRNVVSWNALIAGYTQNGENEEALGLFLLLKRESIWPTHYTFGNLLNACANLADLKLGRQAHSHVLKQGFRFQYGPEPDIFVGNSIIDMYMKCGSVEDGRRVFKTMIERDAVSFNAMIVGFAQNGQGAEALQLFRQMLESGEKPDHVTMIGVLCACSHAGLVEEGRHYFDSMSKDYGLEPQKDHYTCMVDLLGRAGRLNEAKSLIISMPVPPDGVVWGSLLAACKVHRDIDLGYFVAEKLMEIDPTNSGPYVLLSNMYAEVGKWRDVTRVRKLMRRHGIVKQPGCSWIEIGSHVHVFMAKDTRHSQKREIYLLLRILARTMKLLGYVPNISDFDDEEEQNKLEFTTLGMILGLVARGLSLLTNYVTTSLKLGDGKLVMEGATELGGASCAKLFSQKSKGMPRIMFSLDKLVDGAAGEAMTYLSLELFKEFRSVTRGNETGTVTAPLMFAYSTRLTLSSQPLIVINISEVLNAHDPNSRKGTNRVVRAYRRSKARGAILDDTEDDT